MAGPIDREMGSVFIDGNELTVFMDDTWSGTIGSELDPMNDFSNDIEGNLTYKGKILRDSNGNPVHWLDDPIENERYTTVEPEKTGAYIGVDTPTEAGYDAFYATTGEFLADYPLAEPYVMVFETCPSMDVDSGLYLPTSPAIDQFQTQQWCSEIWMDFPWAMAGSETVEIDGETRYAYVECYHVDEATLGVYVYNGNYPPVENPSEPVYKGIARKIKKIYVGINGTARKVKKAYIGVSGVARLCWTQPTIVTISGTGDETYCYVDINGIKYSSAATVEVDIGSEISIFVSSGSRPGQRNCYIALNGVNVQDGAGNYIHIVDTSCNVSLHCDVFGSAEITTT